MSEGIKIESDRRTAVEAETIREAFLGHDFTTTMRFSELNGPEEYDNTHLVIDWPALFENGMKMIFEWKEWISQVKDRAAEWAIVPDNEKKAIARTMAEIAKYDFKKSVMDEKNIKTIRNYLWKYSSDLFTGLRTHDGQWGILNGRMARDKGHKKDLLKVTENRKERDREIEMGDQKKHFWSRGE